MIVKTPGFLIQPKVNQSRFISLYIIIFKGLIIFVGAFVVKIEKKYFVIFPDKKAI